MNPLEAARALYRKGDFRGAIEMLEEYIHQHPGSTEECADLVRAYLKEKNVERAAQVAENGLAQSDSHLIHVARGEVWFRQGRIDDAEKEWLTVLDSGFPDARAYLGMARVFNATAMYKSAKKAIDKAHELDPSDNEIQEYWVNTLATPERIKYLEDALAGENNWDATEREDAKSYLEYLKGRDKQGADSCRLVSKVSATEMSFVRLPSNAYAYGLSVVLNGHKTLLLLDTGASGILVKRSIAQHAGISKIAAIKFSGIGDQGRKKGFLGTADSIKIGELEFQNCPVEVSESRSVAGDDGLIGADLFQDFLVDIDFPDAKLKLSQLPRRPSETQQKPSVDGRKDYAAASGAKEPSNANRDGSQDASKKGPAAPLYGPQDRYIAPEMQSFTGVFRFGHDLLVPTTIGDVPSKLFLVDTGASINFISPAAAREVTDVRGNSGASVTGVSGSVHKVYTAKKAVLQFGHLRQENQEMTSLETKAISDDAGTEISGLLGLTTLGFLDIEIDYRDALINFKYNPVARIRLPK